MTLEGSLELGLLFLDLSEPAQLIAHDEARSALAPTETQVLIAAGEHVAAIVIGVLVEAKCQGVEMTMLQAACLAGCEVEVARVLRADDPLALTNRDVADLADAVSRIAQEVARSYPRLLNEAVA